MNNFSTRRPVASDAPAITRIDADGLATGHATFRNKPHDWESFTASFLTKHGLALVAEDTGIVAGWAGLSPTSARAVYRGVGEVSIYVSATASGRGLGRHLLEELVLTSEHTGYWTLVAQIFPENKASLSLHTAVGFKVVGTRTKLGKMDYGPFAGRWRDVVLLERRSPSIG
ncbi:MAG: N-acetyltransferase family protein [Sulfitobacter sp.]